MINRHSLKRYLNKSYRELERRLEQTQDSEPKKGEANLKHISTTDPDASVVLTGPGRSKLRYKIHRAVDEKAEVITAIAKRQHLMERSFARSKRYGYKRARWRRLWRVEIQEYLTATIQNIMVLVSHVKEQDRAAQAKRSKSGPKRPSFCNYGFNLKSLLSQSATLVPVTAAL